MDIIKSALSPDQHKSLVEHVRNEKSPNKRLEIRARIASQLYDAEKRN